MYFGLRIQAATGSRLLQTIEDCRLVTRAYRVPTWAADPIAAAELPRSVTELKAHMQIALGRRILALEDCIQRSHFLAPLPRSLERARSRSTGLACTVLHSIFAAVSSRRGAWPAA